MASRIGLAVLSFWAAVIFAQPDRTAQVKAAHDAEDQHWAIVNGVPKAEIRAIRLASGILDTSDGVRIGNLDANSLKMRSQILLVENQFGCIRLHVIARTAGGFKEIWFLSGLTDRGWAIDPVSDHPGPGICSHAPRPLTAHATMDARIVVEVPTQSDPFQRSFPVATYTFTWNGTAYALAEGSR